MALNFGLLWREKNFLFKECLDFLVISHTFCRAFKRLTWNSH